MSERKELPTVERCGTCRFWQADEHGQAGECRRHPPSLFHPGKLEPTGPDYPDAWHQPWTWVQMRCGEWKPKSTTQKFPLDAPVAGLPAIPFADLLELLEGVRVANRMEANGVVSWETLLRPEEDPLCWRNLGGSGLCELLLVMAKLGVPAPSHWTVPKDIRVSFGKAGGRFMEYQPTPVPPAPAQ